MGFYGTCLEYLKENDTQAYEALYPLCKLLFHESDSMEGPTYMPWIEADYESGVDFWGEFALRVRALIRYARSCNTTFDAAEWDNPSDALQEVISEGLSMPPCEYEADLYVKHIQALDEARQEMQREKDIQERAFRLAISVHHFWKEDDIPTALELYDYLTQNKLLTCHKPTDDKVVAHVAKIVRAIRTK